MATSTTPIDTDQARTLIDRVMVLPDPTESLWQLVDSGVIDDVIPELPALRLEQDPIHKHKDVLAHTIAVVSNTEPDLRLRYAALFHDIGKPQTRRIDPDAGVTFRHHEAVGAKMTRRRLRSLDYDDDFVRDVTELVRLSGRFKGYASGWSDSAVRRYARDAGPLLGLLNDLVRADCTTRNPRKRQELQHHVDDLEERIAALAEADRVAAERPLVDGAIVMDRFGVGPGPHVGRALDFLLELKRNRPDLDVDETLDALDEWWASHEAP